MIGLLCVLCVAMVVPHVILVAFYELLVQWFHLWVHTCVCVSEPHFQWWPFDGALESAFAVIRILRDRRR